MILKFGSRNGSVVTMLMGTVAMVGVVGVAAMNMIGGPITTAAKVTHQNMAQNDLLMNAKVVVMNASTRPQMGDEDGDGYIEPVPFVPVSDPACGLSFPAGGEGGCLPADIGAILTDPWGTSYAYCVWDHGDPRSSTNRIDGEDSTSGAVLAIISAGPNKQIETTCLPYDGNPETNDLAINPAGEGDDLVQIFTYAGAVAGSGGLWELKDNEPETAVIDKKLEIGDVTAGTGFAFDTATGQGEFPYVKTDFLASKSGGNRPVTMVNNIALDGQWLSGDGTNRGIFIAPNGNVGIGASNPIAPISYYGSPSRDHGDPIGSLEDYDLVIGCKLQQGNCNPGTAVGISVAGYTNANGQPAMAMEYRARGHAFHRLSSTDPIMRIDPEWSYQDSTVVIRSNAANADKGIFGLQKSDGNNVLTVLNNGNIGIGTTAPQNKLHIVDGNISLDNSVDASEENGGNTHLNFITHRLDNAVLGQGLSRGWGVFARGNNFASSVTESGEINDFGLSFYTGSAWRNRLFVEHDTGNIGIGTSSPERILHIVGTGDESDDIYVESNNNVDNAGGTIAFVRSRGTKSAKTAVINNDYLGSFSGRGWIPSSAVYGVGGEIHVQATSDWDQEQSARIRFRTRHGGIIDDRVVINPDGRVGIGTPTPTHPLQVNGIIDVTDNRILRVSTPLSATDAANKAYVDTLGNRTCANGQILKFQSGAWACAGDNAGGGSDNMGNHTATADLTMGAYRIIFGNTATDKVHYYSNTYGRGIEHSTLTDWAASNFRWRIGGTSVSTGTEKMLLSTSGLQITGAVTATTLSGNGSGLTNLNGSNIASGTVPIARIGTGTKNTTTFLRGDGIFSNALTGKFITKGIIVSQAGSSMEGGQLVLAYPNNIGVTDESSNTWNIDSYTGGGQTNVLRIFRQNAGGARLVPLTIFETGAATFNSSVTASAYLYSSDERLKANIQPLELSLDDLEGIHTYRYHYKTDEEKKVRIGVMAQEVQSVFPEAVQTGEDGMMRVDYPALVPVLIEAVNLLNTQAKNMRERMETLEADNDNLRMEIRTLTKEAR